MKLVILAPSATSVAASHDFNAVKSHAKFVSEAGIDVICAVNIDSDLEIAGVKLVNGFEYTIYDDFNSASLGKFGRIGKWFFYRNLIRKSSDFISRILCEEKLTSKDHVYLPTMDTLLLSAICDLKRKADSSLMPTIHVQIMFEVASWMTGGYCLRRNLRLAESLKSDKGGIYLYCETIGFAEKIKEITTLPVSVYPYPVIALENVDRKKYTDLSNYSLVVSVLGGGRRDKGFDRLVNIISIFNSVCEYSRKIGFAIQSPRRQDNLSEAADQLSAMSNVVMLPSLLKSDFYEAVLLSSDVLLLPYSDAYLLRGSGVAMEGLAHGIPLVCAGGTGLCDALIANNGLAAYSDIEFAECLLSIIENHAKFLDGSQMAAGLYRVAVCNSALIRNMAPAFPFGE